MARFSDFSDKQYHVDKWLERDITVLICQRKTYDITRLALESLLRFYPDIPILLVDGNSQDDSILYLRYMSLKHSNITLWECPHLKEGFSSHGVTMHEAITKHVKTKYVLLMDSDVIIERGGCIEGMLDAFRFPRVYAVGTLMLVSDSGEACSPPKNDEDVLRYAHPSFSIISVAMYKHMEAPFIDHGAPCVYSMKAAKKWGYKVEYFPIDRYVSHLCGGSWTTPRTVWNNDHHVFLRPFITFVVNNPVHLEQLREQKDNDFDVIIPGKNKEHFVVKWGSEPQKLNNNLYDIRFNLHGEYICNLPDTMGTITPEFVHLVKIRVIEQKLPKEINVGGLMCIQRTLFQQREVFQ